MPELPEVETIRRRLADLVVGKTINNVEVLREKSFIGDFAKLANKKIINLSRRAKILQFSLDDDISMCVHLKMTGQLIYVAPNVKVGGGHPTADWIHDLPSKHTRVILHFADKTTLFFNDMRVFGWLRLVKNQNLPEVYENYGPDVIDDRFNSEYFASKIAKRHLPIKQLLMNNEIVAGIGNIYAAESLFAAGISPFKSGCDLSLSQIEKLINEAKRIVKRSIELGGTTFDGVYVNVDGFAGGFQKELLVYGQKDGLCPRCQSTMSNIKLGGRSSVYCPSCQK